MYFFYFPFPVSWISLLLLLSDLSLSRQKQHVRDLFLFILDTRFSPSSVSSFTRMSENSISHLPLFF